MASDSQYRVGSRRRTEVIARGPAEAMSGILDIDASDVAALGGQLPPLWHWMYFLDRPSQRELGPDGHPTSGIPVPPGQGRRRMFAGGRVTTLQPLRLGVDATCTSWAAETREKQGRSGPLTFVTVRSEIEQAQSLAIIEEQDIVYRGPGAPALSGSENPNLASAPAPEPRLQVHVDEVLLFRFSALTYNAHRIHYDRTWAMQEGYPDLVVHGPLQALLMGELMRRNGVSLVKRTFSYRMVAPTFGAQDLTIVPARGGLSAGAAIWDANRTLTAVSHRTEADS